MIPGPLYQKTHGRLAIRRPVNKPLGKAQRTVTLPPKSGETTKFGSAGAPNATAGIDSTTWRRPAVNDFRISFFFPTGDMEENLLSDFEYFYNHEKESGPIRLISGKNMWADPNSRYEVSEVHLQLSVTIRFVNYLTARQRFPGSLAHNEQEPHHRGVIAPYPQ